MTGLALELFGLAVSLALVLGAAFLFLRVLKRFQPGGEASAELAFLRTLPVGARERIVLVRWREEVLLIGVAAGSVTLLARAPAPPTEVAETAPHREDSQLGKFLAGAVVEPAPALSDFVRRLSSTSLSIGRRLAQGFARRSPS